MSFPAHLTNHAPEPANAEIGRKAYELRAEGHSWLKVAAAAGARSAIHAYKHAMRHAQRNALVWPPGGYVYIQPLAKPRPPFKFRGTRRR